MKKIQTRLGPAEYQIGAEGNLRVAWQRPQLNRVQHFLCWAEGAQPDQPKVTLSRQDMKPGSAAAQRLVKEEFARLYAALVTPAARHEARRELIEHRLKSTRENLHKAEREVEQHRSTLQQIEQELQNFGMETHTPISACGSLLSKPT